MRAHVASVAPPGVGSGAARSTGAVSTAPVGSTFVLFCIYDAGQFVSVADSFANTYQQIGDEETVGASGASRVYRCEGGTGGAAHTGTLNLTAGAGTIFLVELRGLPRSGALDRFDAIQDTASPYLSPGVTTRFARELLLGLFADNSSSASVHTHGNDFVESISEQNGAANWVGSVSWRYVTEKGTFNTSVTTSGDGTNHTPWITTWREVDEYGVSGLRIEQMESGDGDFGSEVRGVARWF